MKKKERTWKQTLTMIKNQTLIKLGFVLINRQGFLVMSYGGVQVRSNPKRKRRYSLDDDTWKVLCHSRNMSDGVVLKFLKKERYDEDR